LLGISGDSAAQTFTVLANFDGSNGANPDSGILTVDLQGNLWGATGWGGTNNLGTIYEMSPSGALTTVYNFGSAPGDSAQPCTAPIFGTDGNLYGTACGTHEIPGIVYRLTPGGLLTVLHTFDIFDSGYQTAPFSLVQGTDGYFYGVAFNFGSGAVFKIAPDGTFTNLHTFSGPDGKGPFCALVLGPDGYFYGTTLFGGLYDDGFETGGTIFKISPTGTFASLYSFGENEGTSSAALILAKDGNFYGTTEVGGPNNCPVGPSNTCGTIFKMTPNGTVSILHNFVSSDGAGPSGPLLQASDGNFYGTTELGGAYGYGTIFQMTPTGTLTVLHNFTSTDGTTSQSGLLQHPNGQLYGFQLDGGANGDGTVYTITLGGPMANLSPGSLSFGNQQVGTSSGVQTVTLTNAGNATLNITSVSVNGNFFELATTPTSCPYTGGTVAAGANCTIDVTFTPVGQAGLGAQTGTISITDNAAGSPQPIILSGTGIDNMPPTISILANPSTLWPPNGKPVPVTVSGAITDSGAGVNPTTLACAVVDSYGQDQPACSVGSLGTGGAYSFVVSLVASRNGGDKNGRTYTITVSASDYAGNPASAAATVLVPHDQGK
jgi:uncharacterized repeat protein (TIGR03803 family)